MKGDLVSRIQNIEKEAIVELESGSTPHREKSTVEQYMNRNSEKYSKEEE